MFGLRPRYLAPVCLLLLAGCGGGSQSTTSTVATTHKKTPPPKPPPLVTETVVTSAGAGAPGARAAVKSGDTVAFRTKLASGTAPTQVHLTLARRGATWTMTASANGHRATGSVRSQNGKPFALAELHYSCRLPPEPSVCPARNLKSSARRVTATFTASGRAAIVWAAKVGSSAATTAEHPGTLVAPAYTPIAYVEARTPGSHTKPARLQTVSARPGQEVTMLGRLKGARSGARQRVTMSFDQGPAKTLRLKVSVAGGSSSSATIRSAGRSPIALVDPRYSCYLPPLSTFCPALSSGASAHHYRVTFASSPATTVELTAVVQAG